MNVLLIGAPGSGKGTQGELLAERLGLEHIATGDLLRAEVAAGTPLGTEVSALMDRGELVPDSTILQLVLPRIAAAASANGYLLDGFPRSVEQAQEARRLAERLDASPTAVIHLRVPTDVLTERILRRASEQGRSDDTPEVVATRLEVYDTATRPLVDYYRERGLLHEVDADREQGEVTDAIAAILHDLH